MPDGPLRIFIPALRERHGDQCLDRLWPMGTALAAASASGDVRKERKFIPIMQREITFLRHIQTVTVNQNINKTLHTILLVKQSPPERLIVSAKLSKDHPHGQAIGKFKGPFDKRIAQFCKRFDQYLHGFDSFVSPHSVLQISQEGLRLTGTTSKLPISPRHRRMRFTRHSPRPVMYLIASVA